MVYLYQLDDPPIFDAMLQRPDMDYMNIVAMFKKLSYSSDTGLSNLQSRSDQSDQFLSCISWDFVWAAGPTVRRWDQRTRNKPAYSVSSRVMDKNRKATMLREGKSEKPRPGLG